MIYVAALREVLTRLQFQGLAAGILEGLKIKPNGEYRVDGEKDLPQLSMTDLGMADGKGASSGTITLFLRTARRAGWVSMNPSEQPGLYDWAERVLDAIETSPSTGACDTYLMLHKADYTPITKGGQPVALLAEPFSTAVRMSEITELSFLAEIEINLSAPTGRRGNRRSAPVSNTDYAT